MSPLYLRGLYFVKAQATSGKVVASLKRGSSAVSPSENFASKVPYAPPDANSDSTKCLVEKGRSIAGTCVPLVQEYWLAGGGSRLGKGFGEVREMLLHLLQPLQGPLQFCPAQGHGGGERAECLGQLTRSGGLSFVVHALIQLASSVKQWRSNVSTQC